MNKIICLLGTILLLSCNTDENILNTNISPLGNEELIEATSYTDWNYFRFTDSSLQEVVFFFEDPNNSYSWDVAFQRNHIKTNSGTSGIGDAGAYMDSMKTWNGTRFNNFNEDVVDYIYREDTLVNTFYNPSTHTFTESSANLILDTWGVIDTLNNYTMNISNNKYIIKNAYGNNFYKLWVYDYYDENNQSGNVSLIFDIINQ